MEITINGITISDYLDKYQCQINEEYDTSNSFEAIDGTQNKVYLGSRRILQVDFEPMSTAQIQELFSAIKSDRDISITYTDPIDGTTSRIFTCNELPSATYFEADVVYNNVTLNSGTALFWTIPTITFTQKNIENQGGAVGTIYNYRLFIDNHLYTSNRISKDISVTNSISTNGFSVGNIASSGISGKVLLLNHSDVPTKNAEIIFQMQTVSNNVTSDWNTIGIFYLKNAKVSDNLIMSFDGLDSAAFLDNDYYIDYQRDVDGYVIPQSVSGHVSAVAEMVRTLTNHPEFGIPYTCDNVIIQPQNQQNARSLISKVAESGATNYRQTISKSNDDDTIQLQFFTLGQEIITLTKSQISNFEYGKKAEKIKTIILYCGSTTKLPTYIYPEMYKDYNIYIVGNIPSGGYPQYATTLEVQTPYYPFSAANGGGNFINLLDADFGTEFSISKAKINSIIPIGAEIYIADMQLNDFKFYATSLNYQFTKNGLYASISGTSRNISDYFYVGGMQRELGNKLSLNTTYNNIYIDTEGIYLSAPKGVE